MFWDKLKDSLGATRWAYAEPLGPKTTLRVGGAADYYAEPDSVAALCLILQHAVKENINVFILGRGSNVLVRDEGFRGCVLRLKGPTWSECSFLDTGELRVGAGLRLKELCAQACKNGWAGLEFLEGIPGCVGGAIRMNAGAMGGWMHDLLLRVEFVNPQGICTQRTAQELGAVYRGCPALKDCVVTSAWLKCPSNDTPESIFEKMALFAAQRKASQPQQSSAGCMFKNPSQGLPPAGQLIDQLGLKGFCIGSAQVSTKHANFIVTEPGARAQDVLSLIDHVRAAVLQSHGITLEPEVHVL